MDIVLFWVAISLPAFSRQRSHDSWEAALPLSLSLQHKQQRNTLCIQQNSWYNLHISLNEAL